jgi:AcrR family transcriptional regulator
MRLFGEQGYSGTSVSEIEAAAGLSGGSGSLYRHFASKKALLSEGIREQVAAGKGLLGLVSDAGAAEEAPLRESLAMVAVAGLRRLEQERDFNRILIKDLSLFPELLEIARRRSPASTLPSPTGCSGTPHPIGAGWTGWRWPPSSSARSLITGFCATSSGRIPRM